jgi:outer membrane receptor protein involved in Fe transport
LDQVGRFRLNLAAAYLGSFKHEPVDGAGFEELAGKDGRPKWRGRSTLIWNKSDYEGSLTVNYIGSYDRRIIGMDDDEVASWTTLDLQLGWSGDLLSGGKITFGVKNLLDKEPPEDPYLEGWPFINRALHNPLGRFLYLGYKHSF